jgi:hypothetical protein
VNFLGWEVLYVCITYDHVYVVLGEISLCAIKIYNIFDLIHIIQMVLDDQISSKNNMRRQIPYEVHFRSHRHELCLVCR